MPYGFYWYYDPTMILILIGAVFCLLASSRLHHTLRKYSLMRGAQGMTGAEVAVKLLHTQGIYDVTVQPASGDWTDHYDPRNKTVNLSEPVYHQTSVAALGVAAHECGHAIQHHNGYAPLQLRTAFAPVVNLSSKLAWPLFVFGLIIGLTPLIELGIWLFAAALLFQIITLPVEFNASKRALRLLEGGSIMSSTEAAGAKKVLKAAAWTYVAGVAASMLQLLRLIILSGGRRRRD